MPAWRSRCKTALACKRKRQNQLISEVVADRCTAGQVIQYLKADLSSNILRSDTPFPKAGEDLSDVLIVQGEHQHVTGTTVIGEATHMELLGAPVHEFAHGVQFALSDMEGERSDVSLGIAVDLLATRFELQTLELGARLNRSHQFATAAWIKSMPLEDKLDWRTHVLEQW